MQNIILITFKSGLVQYISHNLEALEFISANFADIEEYIVVEPAAQQKPADKPPVDLSELTKTQVIALAAALMSMEIETAGEFGTVQGAFIVNQHLTKRNFDAALRTLEMQPLILADGSEAFFDTCPPETHDKNCYGASKYTTITITEALYEVRQYVYDQAGFGAIAHLFNNGNNNVQN